MVDDSLLSELGADWRRQTADLERLRTLTERRRRRTRLALIVKVMGTALGLVSGAYFVWLALSGAPAIFALAGIALVIALPFMLLDVAGTARVLRIQHDDTPAGVLLRARDQAAAARRLLWGYRIAALLFGACSVALLVLCATGRASMADARAFVPLWTTLALGMWVWQVLRGRSLTAEVARCDALLTELGQADDG